jgi:hypothetical protein
MVKVGIFEFDHVCDLEPSRDRGGAVQPLHPMARYQNVRDLQLNRYGKGPFCKFKIPSDYAVSGVYGLLVGAESNFRYVGECVHLSKRFNALATVIYLHAIASREARKPTAV